MDAPTIQPKFLSNGNELGLVAVGFSGGQCKPGVDAAPMALIESGLVEQLKDDLEYKIHYDGQVHAYTELMPKDDPDHRNMKKPRAVSAVTQQLSSQVYEHAKEGRFVLTLGGDHSIAIGTISGTAKAIRERLGRDIAVIWVDAHADINTPETSESGNIHGMPVAFLTGLASDKPDAPFGWITDDQKISVNKLVYIGLRDIDRGEKKILREHGIKAFSMHDVDRHGIGKVMDMALGWIGSDTPIHLSFDIDALDPMWAPSTGTAVRGGLTLREGDFIAECVHQTGSLIALDLVEVNPSLEKQGAAETVRADRERVVVLGSGWAGYNLARSLNPKKFQTVLVSPRSYFVFTPLLASTSVGTLEFRTAMEPVRSRRSRYEYIQGRADAVDFGRKEIMVRETVRDPFIGLLGTRAGELKDERPIEMRIEASRGELFSLSYDKLVITVGSYSQTFGIPGVKDNAYFLKDVQDARKIRNKLLSCFETAVLPTTPVALKKQLLNFAIVGGGPTGIEFSAELRDIVREDLAKLYPQLMEHVQITVYDVADKILPMFDEKLAKYAMEHFGAEGITIKTSHQMRGLKRGFPKVDGTGDLNGDVKASGYTLSLQNGEESEVGCGFVVWSTGLMSNPFIQKALSSSFTAPASCVRMLSDINASPDSLADWTVQKHPRSGSVTTDDYLRVQLDAADNHADKPAAILRDVFALGDCAVIDGTQHPATAQVAAQKAKWLAKKLNKGDINTRGFSFASQGVMAYIGRWFVS
ncbi:hypothetical protein LTR36_003610 [Oleoguttula mirabilis]|uniref:arginase n=1 Tax=Oleoguttula mirabilis TaxID=1507867 RepID=A0AAV9JIF9_9PEZI|nr:hypothetical protein LTR36_003610 [Oleoguttula mirabilis]